MKKNNILEDQRLEYKSFCEKAGISSAEAFNKRLREGKAEYVVEACEKRHAQKIKDISFEIKKRDRCRIVCISGPSSSGKTTFAQRLKHELEQSGTRAFSISIDDYYKFGADLPIDEDGSPDLESPDAIEAQQLNENLNDLLNGKETVLPVLDFMAGVKIPSGKTLKINPKDVLIVEGIHALNPKVVQPNTEFEKYSIYCTPLNEVLGNDGKRIGSQLTRKLRRLIRDYYYRNASYELTFSTWAKVEKGGEKNIYPLTENADNIFNSALAYEYAAYAGHLEAIFKNITEEDPYWENAQELFSEVRQFDRIAENFIPQNSIIREFIK